MPPVVRLIFEEILSFLKEMIKTRWKYTTDKQIAYVQHIEQLLEESAKSQDADDLNSSS